MARAAEAGRRAESPRRDCQELWIALSRSSWRCLALVPVDESALVADLARTLADVGSQLSEATVTAIIADGLEFSGQANAGARSRARALMNRVTSMRQATSGQILIALPPVITEPLAALVARCADGVVLCVRMKKTRISAARRTISLIGRERIAGCIVVR